MDNRTKICEYVNSNIISCHFEEEEVAYVKLTNKPDIGIHNNMIVWKNALVAAIIVGLLSCSVRNP